MDDMGNGMEMAIYFAGYAANVLFFFWGGGLECVFFQPKDDQTIYRRKFK